MLTDNHIKEGLSRAYILAVAHRAGLNCSLSTFDYGIDGAFRDIKKIGNRYVESGFSIDFQAKASERCSITANEVVYDLEVKAHHDLCDTHVGTPRILIVMALPEDPNDWLNLSQDSLVLKKCAWWLSLRGQAPTKNDVTQRIKIPIAQRFDVAALDSMMTKVRAGVPL